MKYVRQFEIILAISFAGEIFHAAVPLPVPASIYGILLMFLCLHRGLFRTDQVREVSTFLIEIMPMMFIAPAVGLVSSWDVLGPMFPAFIACLLVSTVAVFGAAGRVTQWVMRRERKAERK